jgi:hypothetical protein
MMRRLLLVVVLVALPLALSLPAGPAVAAQLPSPAQYEAGQRCQDAMEQGRTLIRGLPASRAAWNGDATQSLRALNLILDQAQEGRRTCDVAVSDAVGHGDRAEHARLRAAWATYMAEVDRALALITRKE